LWENDFLPIEISRIIFIRLTPVRLTADAFIYGLWQFSKKVFSARLQKS